jgi:hypothetical protein
MPQSQGCDRIRPPNNALAVRSCDLQSRDVPSSLQDFVELHEGRGDRCWLIASWGVSALQPEFAGFPERAIPLTASGCRFTSTFFARLCNG